MFEGLALALGPRGRRALCAAVFLSLMPLAPAHGGDDDPVNTVPLANAPTKPTCKGPFAHVGRRILNGVGITAIGGATLWGGAELVGLARGTPHIGYSIFLDYDAFVNKMRPEDQETMKNGSPEEVVKALNFNLSLNQGHEVEMFPIFKPLHASDFLGKKGPDTDLCRHKAVLMRALLERRGIKAELVTGSIKDPEKDDRVDHVWVYIPELDKIADPTNDEFQTKAEYAEEFSAKEHWNAARLHRFFGLFVR